MNTKIISFKCNSRQVSLEHVHARAYITLVLSNYLAFTCSYNTHGSAILKTLVSLKIYWFLLQAKVFKFTLTRFPVFVFVQKIRQACQISDKFPQYKCYNNHVTKKKLNTSYVSVTLILRQTYVRRGISIYGICLYLILSRMLDFVLTCLL